MDRLISTSTRTGGVTSIVWKGCWKHEHELWLEFLENRGQLERYSRRISKSNWAKAAEAFDEVKAAYFLDNLCGCAVSDWEPPGRGGTTGDFVLQVESSAIFCEVKSPGWEREIVERDGPYASRLKEPKYMSGEAGSFDNTEDLRESLIRAYRQLPADQPCLLIITPDLQVNPFAEVLVDDMPISIHRAYFNAFNGKEGCFTNSTF